jgi:hypothetical protein
MKFIVLGGREFQLGMIGKFLFSDFSKRRVNKEIKMDCLLNRPTITVGEYYKYIADIETRYRVRKAFMCPSCFRVLPKMNKCVCNQ